jgi:FKBP-type peptidyl-prolyl cis-trans isomerase FklB
LFIYLFIYLFLRAGKAFLANNANADGVVVLPSGLQYKILTSGGDSSIHPTRSDTVKVHYRGTTIDGKEFDSSYKRGSPATFGVTQVIQGWTEILQIMSVNIHFI